jgi:hypothetical protein
MTTPVYERVWRNQWLTAEATSIDAMIRLLTDAVDRLTAMQEAGVQFEDGPSTRDDYIKLWTHDPEAARRFGMEVWEAAEEEEPGDQSRRTALNLLEYCASLLDGEGIPGAECVREVRRCLTEAAGAIDVWEATFPASGEEEQR